MALSNTATSALCLWAGLAVVTEMKYFSLHVERFLTSLDGICKCL
jgi:hypothetical protein